MKKNKGNYTPPPMVPVKHAHGAGEEQTAMTPTASKTVGSVMVVGSGIAGMQSAQDLANAGYLVHMVTDSSSVGGKMTQLDKTFPTNECAMCLLGPKMTDTSNHQNINLITCSTVDEVKGVKGDFTVKVRRRPRYVDIEECTACGDCEQVCPVEIPNEFNEGMDRRKAVYKLFPQAVPNKYLIEKRGTPPCRNACPAGTNAQGYVALISRGKFAEALEVVRRRMPFAGICGRICHHPCEGSCNRGQYDDPVAIAGLKRAAYDFGWDENNSRPLEKQADRPEKVAIIGAGPAGLAVALDLAQMGFKVTIFDAQSRPGGMLRAGIPRYRLPEEVVERETSWILGTGIELVPDTRVGVDISIDELKNRGYKAIVVAVGLQNSRMLPLEGSDLQGIMGGMDLLREAALGGRPKVGRRVVVIGGGNVAIDVARTARRLGAERVDLACLESREEMPAHEWEIAEALEEGVVIHPSWGPKGFLGQGGKVAGLEVKRCTSVFDGEGRFNPKYDDEFNEVLPADTVIVAIGQNSDLSLLDGSSVETRGPLVSVDPVTLMTSAQGIFACGDIAHGPKSVVEAVSSAHEVAISVQRYIDGQDLALGRKAVEADPVGAPERDAVLSARRREQAMAKASERSKDFREVGQGYTRDQAIEEAERCLNCGICSECLQCVKACKKNAINHDETEKVEELNVGAVVLAPGYELFDAGLTGEYGYGFYPNVITSLEFERILSSTGPTQSHVLRPSDNQSPKKIAFIQCVGSRDCARDGSEYCSSICCMYSTKEAYISKEHDANIEPTIFYLDMRSYGKNFDKYVDAAKAAGVRYLRTMVSAVREDPVTNNLAIQYLTGDGQVVSEDFDMVVLAVGVRPPKDAAQIADTFEIGLNPYGFAATDPLSPTCTTRDGIYVAGVFQGPRDIPETVMNASAAAALAGEALAAARGTEVVPKVYPQERDVSQEEPRVGVFICHCGINIASVVDVPSVIEYARKLPGVVYAENNLYTCSSDTLKKIRDTIQEHQLNRVVVASCTIRTHQPLFREALRDAGLNQFYFEMANIRDQCSWVHRSEPEKATIKAKDLVHMAVAKVKTHEPLHLSPVSVVPRALIVGGGVAGMTAALSMSGQGFETYLIEKEDHLGGYAVNLRATLEGQDLKSFMEEMIRQVDKNPRIHVYTKTRLEDFGGYQGHYVTTISQAEPGKEHIRLTQQLEHGVVIMATGAREFIPGAHLYGSNPAVVTNTAMEQKLFDHGKAPYERVVFLQCVGSRDSERRYCSRTCCAQSLKNALKIKELSADTEVYILYRDMRTYGFMEEYYKKAREAGVIFIQFEDDQEPQVVERENKVVISVHDQASSMDLELAADCLVLANGAVAPEGIANFASILKLPTNEDGFYVENHAKLGPIDFPSAGVFLCGSGHAPKFVSEAIYQAQGAVARACTVLSQKNLMVGGVVAVVDEEKCAACLTCVRVCPYSVPLINERNVAEINVVQCHGCGNCAAECPAKAIQLQHYKDTQVLAKVAGLFEEVL